MGRTVMWKKRIWGMMMTKFILFSMGQLILELRLCFQKVSLSILKTRSCELIKMKIGCNLGISL